MTRLEALERVAEAAQGALNAEMAEDRAAMNAALGALSAALIRLDALPAAPQPQPAGEVVEVWEDTMGEITLMRPGSFRAREMADLEGYGHARLGTARLPLVTGGEG